MATVAKAGKGYRAQVARKGIRKSKTFATKREAQDWASRQEYLILNSEQVAGQSTFGELLDRYAREVSPDKRGHRWEVIRIEKMKKDTLARVCLGDLKPADFADWRDRRLGEVQPGSVLREINLMNAAINVAIDEWQILRDNPLKKIRKPASPPPRDRLPTQDEIDRMRFVAGEDLTKATARAFHAFLFSIETAMRAGEVCGLTWDNVDLDRRVARLTRTKNGRPRDVPLSSEAVRLLEALPSLDPAFGLTTRDLDALFRKIRDKADVEGLTYHDSRHAAITALSKKLDVLELARMVGHTDLKMLLTYYNESAESLAKRLD